MSIDPPVPRPWFFSAGRRLPTTVRNGLPRRRGGVSGLGPTPSTEGYHGGGTPGRQRWVLVLSLFFSGGDDRGR